MIQDDLGVGAIHLSPVEVVKAKNCYKFFEIDRYNYQSIIPAYTLNTRVFLSSLVPVYIISMVFIKVSLNTLRLIRGILSNSVKMFSPVIIAAKRRVLR